MTSIFRAAPVRPVYVYLQRPDTGEWVTVGRYRPGENDQGFFRYAPSYVDAGLAWTIDPKNLPFLPDREIAAPRYRGLHDVLRDACPDAWGQALLRREHNLPEDAPPLAYLLKASNLDRWGALAVGSSPRPPAAAMNTPKLPQLDAVVEELAALAERRPPVRTGLRARLIQTASVGGARPKATVQGEDGQYWIIKPALASDAADIPLLEHVARQWGAAAGLQFAPTVHHPSAGGRSAVRVLRFDRSGPRRHLCFNAVCGNDDDHVRNHAIVYRHDERRWRLSPAFDVVPNPVETPTRLHMQLSQGRFDISREAMLADGHRFGLNGAEEGAEYLDALLGRIEAGFEAVAGLLDGEWRQALNQRMLQNVLLLRG